MSWEKFRRNRRRRIFKEADFVRVSNSNFKFSEAFWKNQWGECSHVILYVDKEINKIGFEPSGEAQADALRVLMMKNGIAYINWVCLVKEYNLHFDKPMDCRIQREGNFWVIPLLNNGTQEK